MRHVSDINKTELVILSVQDCTEALTRASKLQVRGVKVKESALSILRSIIISQNEPTRLSKDQYYDIDVVNEFFRRHQFGIKVKRLGAWQQTTEFRPPPVLLVRRSPIVSDKPPQEA